MESEMRHNMKRTKLILTNAKPGCALKTTSCVAVGLLTFDVRRPLTQRRHRDACAILGPGVVLKCPVIFFLYSLRFPRYYPDVFAKCH